jgi:hypothetical protein
MVKKWLPADAGRATGGTNRRRGPGLFVCKESLSPMSYAEFATVSKQVQVITAVEINKDSPLPCIRSFIY